MADLAKDDSESVDISDADVVVSSDHSHIRRTYMTDESRKKE